jgi:hypothetical protein
MTSLWCYLVHPPVNWGSNGQTLTQNITKHVHISLSLSLCVFFLVKHIEGKNARLWCEVFQVQLGYQQGNHVDCHQGKVDYRSHTHTEGHTWTRNNNLQEPSFEDLDMSHIMCDIKLMALMDIKDPFYPPQIYWYSGSSASKALDIAIAERSTDILLPWQQTGGCSWV